MMLCRTTTVLAISKFLVVVLSHEVNQLETDNTTGSEASISMQVELFLAIDCRSAIFGTITTHEKLRLATDACRCTSGRWLSASTAVCSYPTNKPALLLSAVVG
jgi:hypothetical protein